MYELPLRLAICILYLYPSSWRAQYQQEMIALLEEHHISLWTIVDLLIGALDACLDPQYRRSSVPLALRQLQISWKFIASIFVVNWIALLFWYEVWDLGLFPSDASWCYKEWPADFCDMRFAVGAKAPPVASAILGLLTPLAYLTFFVFLAFFVGWAVMRTRNHIGNLLRLIPLASCLLLLKLALPFPLWWQKALFIVSLAVTQYADAQSCLQQNAIRCQGVIINIGQGYEQAEHS